MINDGFFDVDDDENNEVQHFGFSPPAFIFILDCSPFMIKENWLVKSLDVVRNWIRKYIFDCTSCYSSIVLVGTDKASNSVNAKHIFVLNQLKLVGADTIKTIDKLKKLITEEKFETEYGFGEFCLPDALWISSNSLFELKRKVEKNIVLFTCKENPFQNAQDRVRTYSKVADMEKSKISFKLFPCKENFERKFFEEIEKIGALEFVDETIAEVKQKHVTLANIPFYISDDYFVPARINYISKQIKMPFEKAHSKASNAPVSSTVSRVRNDDDKVPEIQNTIKYEYVGDKEVRFSLTEENDINAVGERRLKLLGFKPRSTISLELHVQASAFILPNENAATGASNFFSALVERCLQKDVVAICTFCPRPTSTVRYVALAPQTAVTENQSSNNHPIGFLMIYLPFADEIREIPECENNEVASESQVEVMSEVVKKLRFNFDPIQFPNPKLATYWRATEALALDLKEPESVEDSSIPNIEHINQRLSTLKQQLDDSGFNDEPVGNASKKPLKRKNEADSIADISLVEEYYEDEMLGKLNTEQLKNYLRHVGFSQGLSKMKKADLVQKVTEWLGKKK